MPGLDDADNYPAKHKRPYDARLEEQRIIMEDIWANSNMSYQPKHAAPTTNPSK